MKRQPLRGLLPDARQVFQFVDQPRNGFGKVRHAIQWPERPESYERDLLGTRLETGQ